MIYKGFSTASYVAVADIYPGLVGDPKKIGGVGSIGGMARWEGKKRSLSVGNTKLGGGPKNSCTSGGWGVRGACIY